MRRWRRTVLAVALSAALLLPAGRSALGRPFDEVIDSGTIVVAVYRDFPPFSYELGQEPAGIDVDIARNIAAALGVDMQLMPVTADETVDDDLRNVIWKGHYLERRVADLMLHVPVDRQFALRNDQAVIFGPYLQRRIALAYDDEALGSGVETALTNADTIAVEVDSLADFFLSAAYGGQHRAKVVHYRTAREAAMAFLNGTAAAVMAPESEIEAVVNNADAAIHIDPVAMGGFARSNWLVGAAVKEDSRDLRYAVEDVLAAMVADGRMAAIFARHGVSYRSPDNN